VYFPTASRFNVRITRGADWLGEAETLPY